MKTIQKIFYTCFILIFFSSYLTGCATTPAAEQVMGPVTYNASDLTGHSTSTLILVWRPGEMITSDGGHTQLTQNQGLLGAILTAAIENYKINKDPQQFVFLYGKAQQAIFMTSLRDNLTRYDLFKDVVLTADPKITKPNQPIIIIEFKETHVGDETQGFPITLDVRVYMKSGSSELHRRFLIHSQSRESIWKSPSFKEQQQQVSKVLLYQILHTISDWITHHKV